ncbi:hypothetical protein D3C84_849700 [compost metagenome]
MFQGVGRRFVADADTFSAGTEDVAAVLIDGTGRLTIGADAVNRHGIDVVQVAADVVAQLAGGVSCARQQCQRLQCLQGEVLSAARLGLRTAIG